MPICPFRVFNVSGKKADVFNKYKPQKTCNINNVIIKPHFSKILQLLLHLFVDYSVKQKLKYTKGNL